LNQKDNVESTEDPLVHNVDNTMTTARSLQWNIALSFTGLLFIGMLLVDLVAVRSVTDDLIRAKVEEGYCMVQRVMNALRYEKDGLPASASAAGRVAAALLAARPDMKCLLIAGGGQPPWFAANAEPSCRMLLEAHLKKVRSPNKRATALVGRTWGVFWFQRKTVLLAAGGENDFHNGAVIGLAIDLSGLYRRLRQDQKSVLFYLLINLAGLSVIGVYRLSRIYLKPLRRLVKQADAYRDQEELLFSVRREDTELRRLSKALNSMVKRISDDKRKLTETIASLKTANLELKTAQREIIRAEKLASVGRLSAGIAHEIGNPIGVVTGYLELLKRDDLASAERREYLDHIGEEIQRIDAIIRQLLDVSRTTPPDLEPVSIHEIINGLAAVVAVQPLLTDIELEFALDASRDVVMADAAQLRQVFLNLIINAADALNSPGPAHKGRLAVRTLNEQMGPNRNPAVHIQFADNGPGISQDQLNNIFDPFYTTKAPGKGTGLGLSVSYTIIASFGGEIRADSVEGGGTTVGIRLPLFDSAARGVEERPDAGRCCAHE